MRNKVFNIFSLVLVCAGLLSFATSKSMKVDKTDLFKVIRVNGKILFVKTGKDLKTGDAYVNGTPLSFASNRDRAAVINRIKGRYILQPNSKGKAIVLQAASNIESRTGTALLNLLDVKNYFSDSLIFLGDVNVTIGQEAFPLDENHFFYVTYLYKGERIAKKIDYKGQQLSISEERLFEIDGSPIPTFRAEMTLFYMNGDKPQKMTSFYPLFPDENKLKQEVAVLLEELDAMDTGKKLDEVGTYVNEFYGKTQKENLNNWLMETFSLGLKKETNFK